MGTKSALRRLHPRTLQLCRLLCFSLFLKHEVGTMEKFLGIALVVLGVLGQSFFAIQSMTSNSDTVQSPLGYLIGQIMLFMFTIFWTFYTFQSQKMTETHGVDTITKMFCTYALIVPLPVSAWLLEVSLTPDYKFEMSVWAFMGVFQAIFFSSVVAYTLYNEGVNYIESSVAVGLGGWTPISARLLSVFFVSVTKPPHWYMTGFNYGDLCLIFVIFGLGVMVYDSTTRSKCTKPLPEELKPLILHVKTKELTN